MKLQQRDISLHIHRLPVYDQQNNQQKRVPETAVHILLQVHTELYKDYRNFTTHSTLEKH
jgi:hypothetical protein